MIHNQLNGSEQVIDDAGEVDAAALIELMERAGFEPRSYSGRYMYGKECIAIYTDATEDVCLSLVGEWAQMVNGDGNGTIYTRMEELLALVSVLEHPHRDSMGTGGVIYWPSLPWPDGVDEVPPLEVAPGGVEDAE